MAEEEAAFREASRRLWDEVLEEQRRNPRPSSIPAAEHAKLQAVENARINTTGRALSRVAQTKSKMRSRVKFLNSPLIPPSKLGVDISTATAEQRAALNMMCLTRDNVFVTGRPGTGKSWLLHLLRMALRERDEMQGRDAPSWFVVAPSAKAACEVEGSTIHNMFGLSIIDDRDATPPDEALVRDLSRMADDVASMIPGFLAVSAKQAFRILRFMKPLAERLRELETLIIDEVSMVSPTLFRVVSEILSAVRNSPRPFGGVILRIFGDFFQLPPVHKALSRPGARPGEVVEYVREDGFSVAAPGETRSFTRADGTRVTSIATLREPVHCFEAGEWARCAPLIVELREVVRQKGDAEFVDLLERMRRGELSLTDMGTLRSRAVDGGCASTSAPVLMSRLRDVSAMNERRLDALPGEKVVFHASMHVTCGRREEAPESEGRKRRREKRYVTLFERCPPFTRSYASPAESLDGWRGQVFRGRGNVEVDGAAVQRIAASIERDPPAPLHLELKEGAIVCLRKNGCVGDVGNGDTGVVTHADPMGRFVKVLFDRTRREALVEPQDFKYQADGLVFVHYVQLPLELSFARSIHKAQGQTIPRLILDLSQVFEYGQAYVALSRAPSLESVGIVGDMQRVAMKCRADPRVLDFYRTMRPQELAPVSLEPNRMISTSDPRI